MSAALSAQVLLALWEQGRSQTPGRRALELLAAGTGLDPAELAAWNVGRRDRALMQMLAAWDGPRCSSRVACPSCGELAQVDLDLAAWANAAGPLPPHTLTIDGVDVHWRLPTAGDLAALPASASLAAAREMLLRLCVGEVNRGGSTPAPDDWPAGLLAAVQDAIAAADPLSDIELCLQCWACGGDWVLAFDATVFLWARVDEAARDLLSTVHRLATAYGWGEADILAMSTQRRAAYREMCDA